MAILDSHGMRHHAPCPILFVILSERSQSKYLLLVILAKDWKILTGRFHEASSLGL